MKRFLHKWHKRIGLVVASFVVLLVITGIILNHSDYFRINTTYISNTWLLDIYNIQPKKTPVSFVSNETSVTQIDERLYLNEKELLQDIFSLHGIIDIDNEIVIALDNELIIASKEGEIIERLTSIDGVPSGMKKIGSNKDNPIIIQASHGLYAVDLDTLDWKEAEYKEVNWVIKSAISKSLEERLIKQFRGKGLNLERLIQDMHSGRIAGRLGIWIMDVAAFLLLLLAVSGFIMWWK